MPWRDGVNVRKKESLARHYVVWYNGCMTNNMHPGTVSVPMTRREIQEQKEFERNAPWGSYFANALAFIVESLSDDETPVHNTDDFENNLSPEDIMEWAEMYNFTIDAFHTALEMFRKALDQEVHNAFYNGDCRNCMENPPEFN